MKTPTAFTLASALGLFWLSGLPSARAEWLALDGENNIWWLADTNGAVTGLFAHITPSHQQWMGMNRALNGGASVLKIGGAVMENNLGIITFDGTTNGEASGFDLGPYRNGDLGQPGSWTFDATGDLYIADNYYSHIVHYNGTNATYLGVFVTNASPNNLTFGPDGNLYVADRNLGVVRYNGTNGAYLDTFVPLGTNGVPDAANLIFGPDGNLYVASTSSNAVIRFDGGTGRFMDYFVTPGSGGLGSASGLVFGPDGNLYVSSGNSILRYDGRTGAFLNAFASGVGYYGLLGLAYVSDTNPPTVTITSPTTNTMVSGTVTVSANATDNGTVTAVQFRLDGTNFGAPITAAPYAVPWNTTTMTDGQHTVTGIAWDATGNQSTSAPVVVTVSNGDPADTTPPAVTVTAPSDGATVSGAVTISADATDNVSVAYVQFQLDGANLGWQITNAPYSLTWNSASVTNGTHVLTAVARDTAGNQTVSSPVTVTAANSDPGQTLFVSDANGNIIKITPDGSQNIFASGTNNIYGLAFDRAGNLFAAEYGAGAILKFTPAGAQTAFTTASNSCKAYSLAFDGGGNLFADCANVIYKYAPGGSRTVFTTTALNSSYPGAETFDSAGDFYFTTWTFNTPNGGPQDIITEYEPDGSSRTYETLQGFQGFYGMAFDSGGTLRLNGGGGVVVDFYGNLYEASQNTGSIYKIAPDGTQSTYATGLNGPVGLALAPNVTTPGILLAPPPSAPQLTIQPAGNRTVQISWPSAAGNSWTLCRQQNCNATNAWDVMTNPPALVGTNYVVTEPCASTACFYRLKK